MSGNNQYWESAVRNDSETTEKITYILAPMERSLETSQIIKLFYLI